MTSRRAPLSAVLIVLAAAALVPASPAIGATTVTNPGFESNGASQTPASWSESGTAARPRARPAGAAAAASWPTGRRRPTRVETYQMLTGLTAGLVHAHRLGALGRRAGGGLHRAAQLRRCRGAGQHPDQRQHLGPDLGDRQRHRRARAGQHLLQRQRQQLDQCGRCDVHRRHHAAARRRTRLQIIGACDVSSAEEERGPAARSTSTSSGAQRDALAILRSAGVNYAPAQGVGQPGRRLQQQGPGADDGHPHQGAGHEAARRLPLLRLLGRPGQAGQAGGLGHPTLHPAARRRLQPHLRRDQLAGSPGHAGRHGADRQRDQPGHAAARPAAPDNWANLATLLTAGANAAKAAIAVDAGHAAPGRGRQQRAVPLVVRQRHVARRAVRRHRRVVLPATGTARSPACRPTSTTWPPATASRCIVVGDGVRLHPRRRTTASRTSSTRRSRQAGGYPATAAGPDRRAPRRGQRRAQAVPNGRGIGVFYWEPAWTAVTGAGWDPDQPSLRQRLGEPGAVRLQLPGAAGDVGLRSAEMRLMHPATPGVRPARFIRSSSASRTTRTSPPGRQHRAAQPR